MVYGPNVVLTLHAYTHTHTQTAFTSFVASIHSLRILAPRCSIPRGTSSTVRSNSPSWCLHQNAGIPNAAIPDVGATIRKWIESGATAQRVALSGAFERRKRRRRPVPRFRYTGLHAADQRLRDAHRPPVRVQFRQRHRPANAGPALASSGGGPSAAPGVFSFLSLRKKIMTQPPIRRKRMWCRVLSFSKRTMPRRHVERSQAASPDAGRVVGSRFGFNRHRVVRGRHAWCASLRGPQRTHSKRSTPGERCLSVTTCYDACASGSWTPRRTATPNPVRRTLRNTASFGRRTFADDAHGRC